MKLTTNFSLEEFTISPVALRLGIDNSLPHNLLEAAVFTLQGLEKLQAITKSRIIISSGYRCNALNSRIGGARLSQHMRAEAVDTVCPGVGTVVDYAHLAAAFVKEIGVDQMIYEYGLWVHLSFTAKPRNEILTIRNAKEGYIPGLII